jgi:hypothetical protein
VRFLKYLLKTFWLIEVFYRILQMMILPRLLRMTFSQIPYNVS